MLALMSILAGFFGVLDLPTIGDPPDVSLPRIIIHDPRPTPK